MLPPPLFRRSISAPWPSGILVGQAGTALRTAAGEHLPAVPGGHALAKAALLGPLELFGLIGTLHPVVHLLYTHIPDGQGPSAATVPSPKNAGGGAEVVKEDAPQKERRAHGVLYRIFLSPVNHIFSRFSARRGLLPGGEKTVSPSWPPPFNFRPQTPQPPPGPAGALPRLFNSLWKRCGKPVACTRSF